MNYTENRPTCVMDTECYLNYWAIAFKCVDSGRTVHLCRTKDKELDRARIAKIFKNWRVISFNGWNYDMPMITLAMSGATNGELKRASDEIITCDLRPWQFYEKYGVDLPNYLDHVDLMEVSPGSPTKPSLKMYAGRLHSKRMQDLPFEPDRVLSAIDIVRLDEYHINDLDVTRDLYFELKPQIDLRAQMSEQYGTDLRSKSDAQVAEAVIKTEIERLTKRRIYKPDITAGVFKYTPPAWVRFETPEMQQVLAAIKRTNFIVKSNGVVEMPDTLADLEIRIGDGVYRMGIGGLHSSENRQVVIPDDDHMLIDEDCTSYYPSLILTNRWFPKHIGDAFLRIYQSIFERRIAAKKSGDKTTAETLKIVLNGSFGKFGSPYSTLYSPNLMIQVTVSGQLGLLMLIEQMHMHGMRVVSANTDGFVTVVPKDKIDLYRAISLDWTFDTGIGLEETHYRGLWSRDVNSYIAITTDGKVKTKGAFTLGGPGLPGASGLKKNPAGELCIEALIAHLKDGTPIEQTIRDCADIRKFVYVRRVNGGCLDQDGELVGKVVRWYYATGVRGTLKYKTSGNDVPKTEGAKPLMELPEDFPDDVDNDWYVRETTAMMQDIGLAAYDPALQGRTGTMLGRMGDQKTYHHVRLPGGVALCGKSPDSIRDRWEEAKKLPLGYRLCSKCVKAMDI